MTRLFIDKELSPGMSLQLGGDRAHYLLRVLRCRPGQEFVGIDTASRRCVLRIDACDGGAVSATVVSADEAIPGPQLDLHLYPAILKGGNFDLVIQKATELGVSAITPIITGRTISRPPRDRIDKRVSRWRKIAEEACRQCGRRTVPTVSVPLDWGDALADRRERGIPGIIPYEVLASEDGSSLRACLNELKPCAALAAFIGPEGGFTPQEADQAMDAGLVPVSLGSRILRAETASIALCAMVMYEMENG